MPIWAINHIEFTGAESKTDWNILCYDWLRFFGWFLWEFRRSWVVYTVHHSTIINQLQFLKDHLYTSHSAKYVPAPSVTLSLNNDLSVCFWGKRAAMSSLYTLWESSMARWKIPWKSYENPMIFPVKAPCDTYRGYSQLAMLTATGIPKMVLEITCFTMFYLNHLYINGYFPYLHLPKGNHWTMRRTREEPEEPIWVGRSAYPPHPLCTFSRRRSLVPRPETRWSCRCHWCHSSGAPSCVKHVAYGLMDEWNHPSPVACFRQKMRIFVLSDANVIPKYWVLLELIRFEKGFWEHGCDNVVTYVLDFSDVREDPSPFCWNISPSLTCRNSLVVDTLLRGQILSGWWFGTFFFPYIIYGMSSFQGSGPKLDPPLFLLSVGFVRHCLSGLTTAWPTGLNFGLVLVYPAFTAFWIADRTDTSLSHLTLASASEPTTWVDISQASASEPITWIFGFLVLQSF